MEQFDTDLMYSKRSLNIEFEFSKYQLQAMRSLHELRDTIAVLPTGSGKSLIYQVKVNF